MERRTFLKCAGCGAAAVSLTNSSLLPDFLGGIQNVCAFEAASELSSEEARHYVRLEEGGIECRLCPRHCRVTDLERGYCGVRENRDDTYYTLVYGRPCSLNIDPVEKKPLFHFYPGTNALSLATAGCNVNCKFCQNWQISQTRPEQTNNIDLPPSDVIALARERHTPTIAYTYSEPVIFYEYMYDIAARGKEVGLKSVIITGGYIEEQPYADLLPLLSAVKVDLKGIREEYYREVVNGELKAVLDRLVQVKQAGVWLEVVYLVVPTLNDSDAEFHDLARWIRDNLGTDVPLHLSRFYPQYLLTELPPTPLETLERAHGICTAEGLEYVYIGNVPGHPTESTHCPKCGSVVIERRGYSITRRNLVGGSCGDCGKDIPGLF